jgi:thiol-disulfide isomerase/thioredoxin
VAGWGAPEVRGSNCDLRHGSPWGVAAIVLLASILGLACVTSPLIADTDRLLQAAKPEAKPAFSLPAVDGAQYYLQQKSGRVVLVHFFATWCEPCREELTSLSRLVSEAGPGAPVVLAVNVAEVPVRVRRYLETTPVNFPVLLDIDRAVTKAWGVTSLPTSFVLDRSLRPRLYVERDIDWTNPEVLAALDRVGSPDPK